MFYWYMINICFVYNFIIDNKFRLNIIKVFLMYCEIIDIESVIKILIMFFYVYKDNIWLFMNYELY